MEVILMRFVIRDMGLELFRSQLLQEISLREKIVQGAIDMITTER